MKKIASIFLLSYLFVFSSNAQNQNVAINNDGAAPDAKAILDIKSTDKGILIPRMTSAQRNAITTIPKGLTVFDTETNSFWFYTGTAWAELAAGWKLRGNSTTTSFDFIGTTNDMSLNFRSNNFTVGTLSVDNVAFGLSTGSTGYSNVALGKNALRLNSKNNIVGIGDSALAKNNGIRNTAIGSKALYYNYDGLNNTAVGFEALYSNTMGQLNTAAGSLALYSNTNGSSNTGLGAYALYDNIDGNNNVAIGQSSLSNNTTGSSNVAVGYSTLNNITTGSYNTAIGYGAGPATNLSNTTGIGYNADVAESNTMRFGNSSVIKWGFGRNVTSGVLQVGDDATNGNGAYLSAAGTWVNVSDFNKKENIVAIEGSTLLNNIMELPINRWSYKGETGVTHIGPMAQDFYRIFKVGDNDKAISTIDPAGIALAAIQEQQRIILKQQQLIEQLTKRIEKLEANH